MWVQPTILAPFRGLSPVEIHVFLLRSMRPGISSGEEGGEGVKGGGKGGGGRGGEEGREEEGREEEGEGRGSKGWRTSPT